MAAVVLALVGIEVLFLGGDSPTAEIARVARERGARAVALSVSAGYDPVRSRAHFEELQRALPPGVSLLAGGSGLTEAPPGVISLTDFEQLKRHCQGAT